MKLRIKYDGIDEKYIIQKFHKGGRNLLGERYPDKWLDLKDSNGNRIAYTMLNSAEQKLDKLAKHGEIIKEVEYA